MALPLYSPSARTIAPIERLLLNADIPFTLHSDWEPFLNAIRTAETSVLVADWLRDLQWLGFARANGFRRWVGLVLITNPHPDNLRYLVKVPAAEVLFLDRDLEKLIPTLHNVRRQSVFERLGVEVRMRTDLPLLLRRALLTALEHEPANEPLEDGDAAVLPRSVRALALRIKCSEDHLSDLARRTAINLPDFLKWVVALRALQTHEQPGTTWEAVAWRLGFHSVSGLSEHLKHVLGARPSALGRDDIDNWFLVFERRFLLSQRPEPDASPVALPSTREAAEATDFSAHGAALDVATQTVARSHAGPPRKS